MDTASEFAERYKKMSNSQLMELLQNPSHYQPAAYAVAKAEFNARQLSENELEEAKQDLLSQTIKKERRDEKIETAKTQLLDAGSVLYDTVNPVQTTAASAVKLIRFIIIVFAGLVIFSIVTNADLFYGLLNGDSYGSFGYTIILFPVLVQLTAIVFFLLRKHIGWILLAAFCSYSLVQNMYGLYASITRQFNESGIGQFFPSPPPATFIISILFYAGIVLVLKRLDVMEIYKMDKRGMQRAIAVGCLVGVLSLFLMVLS